MLCGHQIMQEDLSIIKYYKLVINASFLILNQFKERLKTFVLLPLQKCLKTNHDYWLLWRWLQ